MVNSRKKRGFTLIELIMVITIIGILSTVILVNYESARAKSRDAKRKGDISSISGAIGMYYSDKKSYPCSNLASDCRTNTTADWATSVDTDWNQGTVSFSKLLAPYLPNLPLDPKNNSNRPWSIGSYYSYAYRSDNGTKYDLVTKLENTSDPDRCELRQWTYYHSNTLWCGSYSPYIFADH